MYIFLGCDHECAESNILCIGIGFLYKNFFPDRPHIDNIFYITFICIVVNKDRCCALYFFEEGGTVRRRKFIL